MRANARVKILSAGSAIWPLSSPRRSWRLQIYRIDLDQGMVHIHFIAEVRSDRTMRVAVSNAKGRLTELIRRAEAGEEVVLTRRGQAVVRLVPVGASIAPTARRKLLDAVRVSGAAKARSGENSARSQDFLYGADGLPG